MNIDQDVDSKWPLYIEDHLYNGHEVFLAPGEMIFYEIMRLARGRPTELNGERFVKVFAHFQASKPRVSIDNGIWQMDPWFKAFPKAWVNGTERSADKWYPLLYWWIHR